jgi:hypothetical protein
MNERGYYWLDVYVGWEVKNACRFSVFSGEMPWNGTILKAEKDKTLNAS